MKSRASSAASQIVHVAHGRVRVHWPHGWVAGEPDVESLLGAIGGARAVRANALTRNVLVQFDERVTDASRVAAELDRLAPVRPPAAGRAAGKPTAPEARPLGAEPLTLELIERLALVISACAGLGIVAMRTRKASPLAASRSAAGVAAAVSVLDGSPELRALARRAFGDNGRAMMAGATAIVAQTVAGSPLGLTVAGLVAIRQLIESLQRRGALQAYLGRSSAKAPADTGWLATLDDGDRLPLGGRIIRGTGSAIARNGLPRRVGPDAKVGAGARLFGDSFVVELRPSPPAARRPAPDDDASYLHWMDIGSFVAGAITFITTRSLSRAVGVVVLLSPRPAVLAREAANVGANLRALRCGALPVRRDVALRRPDIVLLGSPRVITDGLVLERTELLDPSLSAEETVELGASVAALSGWPWGPIKWPQRRPGGGNGDGSFDGEAAHAKIDGRAYTLRPDRDGSDEPFSLVLRRDDEKLAVFSLRPRLARHAKGFAQACRRLNVKASLIHDGPASRALRELALEVGLELAEGGPAAAARRAAHGGRRLAIITDAADESEALGLASLSIGLATGLSESFSPAVDVLAPDLVAAAAVLEAATLREASLEDAHLLGLAANVLGSVRIARGAPPHRTATTLPNLAAIVGLVVAWARLRGGSSPRSSLAFLVDPRPERWGRREADDVLRALASSRKGLTTDDAASRARHADAPPARNAFAGGVVEQLRSPMTGVLVVGAGLSLATGAAADVVLISAVIALNALLGAVQEHQAGSAAAELERMGRVQARVLRDGDRVAIPGSEIVPGDVLLLGPGDRVAADARVLRSRGLSVDEAPLTGESFPLQKRVDGGPSDGRIVLDGTDVTAGSGRAVAFAVGRDTRFGATAAAVTSASDTESPLGRRLHGMLLEILPVVVGGGALVILAGLLWRRPLRPQLAIAAGTAIAAVPEGLPLLASVGQAGVARRLAARKTLVRRLTAVEALGRVDVACVDKTGTLTENRLSVQAVVALDGERGEPADLSPPLRLVLRSAAMASPRAGSSSVSAHATDVAVLEGARTAGLASGLHADRAAETPFDASRPFHAASLDGRLFVKGSPEELVERCTLIRRGDAVFDLDESGRSDLLRRVQGLAEEGLRVLMVAEGDGEADVGDPQGLVALGFLGIRDTVRAGVAQAVERCRAAGIRLIMLTGDHPATARAIGREIGLLGIGGVLTGLDIEHLSDDELADALEGAAVVARISPLEKVRIVEALRGRGHVVAMTGDGVNDGPALRLADVGVAMGRSGTEVARQAGDVVLADDDFGVLVETLIEGRTFWANLRRSLAMLLGGNLGEVAFIVVLASVGVPAPLTARQVLAVNLVSDVLPALSLVIQSPRQRDLSQLAREGDSALGAPLRAEIFTRAVATAVPAVAVYAVSRLLLDAARSQSIGFASIVVTQLTQTLDASRAAGGVSRATALAVGGTVAALAAALHLRPLATFLGLTSPGVLGWLLIAASGAAAPSVARALDDTALRAADRSLSGRAGVAEIGTGAARA